MANNREFFSLMKRKEWGEQMNEVSSTNLLLLTVGEGIIYGGRKEKGADVAAV